MNPLAFAPHSGRSLPLQLVSVPGFETWLDGLDEVSRTWSQASGFSGKHGQVIVFRGPDGTPKAAAVGIGTKQDQLRHRYALATARNKLPKGDYRLCGDLPDDLSQECLGWLLEGYRFAKFRDAHSPDPMLVAPDTIDASRLETIASGEALTRDLINTPANLMGPEELQAATVELAQQFSADVSVLVGPELEQNNLPMIHAVGRASPRPPRLIDLRWGGTGPRVTLVGKGVCFDTGGLNLKPGPSMGLMKKDMGGAAAVLGLAAMIMALDVRVRLRVLIPAVENALGGAAFRPGDVLVARNGLSVEINNTDAEGRLVLADAVALADESDCDLMVTMATLTGAARVALGPDIAPFFTDNDALATALTQAGDAVRDPVWRLPFWEPYEAMIEPDIADLDNSPKGGFAGAITAALFLRRFVNNASLYAHFDIFGWQPSAAPGRPKGGTGQGARALLETLPAALDL